MSLKWNPATGQLDLVGGSNNFKRETVPVTITTKGAWTNVPLSSISIPFNAEVFDASNLEKVLIDVRILSSAVEIRSNRLTTYTIRIDGE